MSAAVHWLFTLNNYTPAEISDLCGDEAQVFRYLCFGKEVGSNGTPHLQGYFQLKKKARLSRVKLIAGLERAHFEIARGTPDENREYCSKDGDFHEQGECTGQGHRTDIEKCVELIKSAQEIPLEMFMRYHKGIVATRQEHLRRTVPMERDVRVVVLCGDPGTGKSTEALLSLPPEEVYVHCKSSTGHWFDGYVGQKRIVLEEFNPVDYDINFVKRLLDKWQLQLSVKGGFTYAAWSEVYITCQARPDTWYSNGHDTDRRAVARRINEVYLFTREGDTYSREHIGDGYTAMKLSPG